jgi:hypothetical protein
MLCEGKIGCHACLNFLQILEAKLNKILEVEEKQTAVEEVLTLIEAFKKGG